MASALALASSSSAFLVTRLSVKAAQTPRTFSCRVTCSYSEPFPVSKRVAVSLTAAAAIALLAAGPVVETAQAKDIPLFGIKSKAKKAVENATDAVQEASGNIFDAFRGNTPSISAPKISNPEDKATKAGAVVVADVIALLVASSVVSGLLKPSS